MQSVVLQTAVVVGIELSFKETLQSYLLENVHPVKCEITRNRTFVIFDTNSIVNHLIDNQLQIN